MPIRHCHILSVAACSISLFAIPANLYAGEGVVEINQARAEAGGVSAGDGPDYPVTIDTSGSYRLTGFLTSPADEYAIDVSADNVTLDLRGFSVSGTIDFTGTDFGKVMNGSITSGDVTMGHMATVDGVNVSGGGIRAGQQAQIINNSVVSSESRGIAVASGGLVINNHVDGPDECIDGIYNALIKDNYVTNCGQKGIDAFARARIIGNTVFNVSGVGIYVNNNALVIDNMVNACQAAALQVGESSGYRSNAFTGNNGGNSNPQVFGGTELGSNICGDNDTCP